MNKYKIGEVVGNYRVGDRKKKFGTNDYEVFVGDKWIGEWLYEMTYIEEEKLMNNNKCDGCGNPFCEECVGISCDKNILMKEIFELLDMNNNINKEIRKRLTLIGGDAL